MPNKNALIVIIVVVVVVVAATFVGALLGGGIGGTQAPTADTASSTVASFGKTLQQVSILAPDASTTIASTYAPYVDPALLAQWEADPQSAPGRVVSSPWPDRIQIDSIVPQGSGFVVRGELVFMTSNEVEHGGNAGTTPVVIQLANEEGKLMIVAFEGQNSGQ
ncbi:MAG TPA: hypothetical protein VMH91_02015 [Candidatus Paceibacterota bacterium]|nr:hypothetical protein [Candidatus Paceibacterota bacterium]